MATMAYMLETLKEVKQRLGIDKTGKVCSLLLMMLLDVRIASVVGVTRVRSSSRLGFHA